MTPGKIAVGLALGPSDEETERIKELWRQVQLSAEALRKIIHEELGGAIH